MKKVLFAAVAVIALASCNKKVDCSCTSSTNFEGIEPTTTVLEAPSKSDCEALSSSTTSGDLTSETKCEVK